ncbi:MAG TPA: acyl-CoA dehydrogenase family protein [Acidimicrobiales bacterium]|nr:acyl-CoA dehydrogenase family protein [Acidimicrobiales bacterium]
MAPDEEDLVRARVGALLAAHRPGETPPERFWGAQFDAGLAWVGFPPGTGGLGVEPGLQVVVEDLLRAAGVPSNWERNPAGLGAGAPALLAAGSDGQRRRWLRPLFTCAEVWCQLFTEPGAGSDLAAVATAAVRQGDEWIVRGRKVFSTLAHVARWGLLLARTDPELPRHRGLTCFVLDMTAAGVAVRPVRAMDGDAEFDEVVVDGARVPDTHRLGPPGGGWQVAVATLASERLALPGPTRERHAGPIGEALRLWRDREHHDPVLRNRLAGLWVDAEVARLTVIRARAGSSSAAAVARLLSAEVDQRVWELCVELLGADGALYDTWEPHVPRAAGESRRDARRAYLRSRALTIQGGTTEITRSLLAERVLGLPPSSRV